MAVIVCCSTCKMNKFQICDDPSQIVFFRDILQLCANFHAKFYHPGHNPNRTCCNITFYYSLKMFFMCVISINRLTYSSIICLVCFLRMSAMIYAVMAKISMNTQMIPRMTNTSCFPVDILRERFKGGK